MKYLYFVEHYSEFINKTIHKNDNEIKIIALNPKACQDLSNNNIRYSIPEYYELWIQDEKFYSFFNKWINKLDELYFKNEKRVHYCVAPIHSILNNYIRSFVTYKKIIEVENPDNIIYFVSEEQSKNRIINLMGTLEGKSFFDSALLDDWITKEENRYYLYTKDPFYERVKKRWRDLPFIRESIDYIRSYRFLPSWKNKKILFVNFMLDEIRDAKKKGYKVDVLPNFKHINFTKGKIQGINISLFNMIEEEYGIPAKVSLKVLEPIIESYLNTFMVCVKDFEEVFTMVLNNNKYDCMVFRHKNMPYHFGAFLAGKKTKTKMVYIRHGWDAYYDPITYEIRRSGYDYFISPTLEFRDYLEGKIGDKTYVI